MGSAGVNSASEWTANRIAQELPSFVRARLRIVHSLRTAFRAHVAAVAYPRLRGKLHCLAAFIKPCPSLKPEEFELKLKLTFLVVLHSKDAYFSIIEALFTPDRALLEVLEGLFEAAMACPPPPQPPVKLRVVVPNAPNPR